MLTDIDECKDAGERYPCHGKCHNTIGDYECKCPLGMRGDGKRGCRGFGIITIIISGHQCGISKTKVFSSEELETATDGFNVNRILGQGGQGTVYKGMLADGVIVAVKRSLSVDQTHLTTNVQGTYGYLDPEYFWSSQYTDKSDVYSFGVVLAELLTGQKAILTNESQERKNLAAHFVLLMEENRIFDIVDAQIKEHCPKQDVIGVANIAMRCLNLNGKKRPTMKQVTSELERIIQLSQKKDVQQNNEEAESITAQAISARDDASTSITCSSFQVDQALSSSDVEPLYTDKSDVYSFGVVLAELLTRQKAILTNESRERKNLAAHFVLLMEENRIFDIVDAQIKEHCPKEDVIGVANIAMRCLNLNRKKRPTMKQVTSELERIIQLSQKKDVQQNNEEAESITAQAISARDDASTSITCSSFQVDQALSSSDVEPLVPFKTW
ncbi:hypothetical protein POTOM_035069 [Populus tomentosa]|uniref:Uncharacterized protein n=1 Tax=Populus tomentosa TaxID=118781 RepID=A0A8X7Z5Z1_POPTO|nr:hypothetical protein POTOM_035069 [Populus tomentosa]